MIKERKKEMQNFMKKTRGQKMKNIMNQQKDSYSSMKSFFRKFKRSTEKVKITLRKYTLDLYRKSPINKKMENNRSYLHCILKMAASLLSNLDNPSKKKTW